jgi:hypothetical protein
MKATPVRLEECDLMKAGEGILSFHEWTDAQAAGSIFSSPLDTTSPQLHRKSGAWLASRPGRPIKRAERRGRPR